jgi:hypothetical protein
MSADKFIAYCGDSTAPQSRSGLELERNKTCLRR